MPIRQQLFAIGVSLLVFVFTIEMVRTRKLREEYSVLWLATSFLMFVLVLKYEWLIWLTTSIGAVLPTTTLFLGSIIFLVLMAVQFSIKISRLTDQVKDLVQENALLRRELQTLKSPSPPKSAP
jgi:cell division protein FtsB